MAAAEEVDQAWVEASSAGFLAADQARIDTLAEFLAKLHAPLVEGVDAPEDALYVDLVLVLRRSARRGGGR